MALFLAKSMSPGRERNDASPTKAALLVTSSEGQEYGVPTLCPTHKGICVQNHSVCGDVPGVGFQQAGTGVGQDKEADGARVGGEGI